MARPLRIEYPGALYHVFSRGNAGEDLYRAAADREKFLIYVEKAVGRFSLKLHAYCLMPNHFHLLLETVLPNLSQSMQWILFCYAAYFNRKYKRHGHLFQGRFKSILVDGDAYLKQLSRYIHLNPVRLGLVSKPISYLWSSYPAFAGNSKPPQWLETGWLLSQFGRNEREAKENYIRFVEADDGTQLKNPFDDSAGGCILGGPDFVEWVKGYFLSPRPLEVDFPQLRQLKPVPSIKDVIKAVCDEYNCDKSSLTDKGRKRNTPRDTAIFLSRELTSATGRELANFFGFASGTGVSSRYHYVLKKMNTDRRYSRRVNRIKALIMNNVGVTPFQGKNNE
jgi:REP element-mobilizing transposase RayT